ncbi:GatB/YqeY domain-containing protein [Desulfovibrionales bacterium]
MNLYQRIEQDYIVAFKAKQADIVAVLRMLKAAIKNKQVELLRELSDAEILDVVIKQVKQRQDSIEQFQAARRLDLANIEEREAAILRTYLPKPLSTEELDAVLSEIIRTLGATSMKDMGKVMNAVLASYAGRVDGKELSAVVRSKLSA